jgi:glycerol-3-phosphate responsive antiterminator
VVVFGGEQEITTTEISHDTRVAGVISTKPGYIMNSKAEGIPVALTGRTWCRVQGPVTKGDLLVSSSQPGIAQVLDPAQYKPGCVLGKSIEDIRDDFVQSIEVVVGRF